MPSFYGTICSESKFGDSQLTVTYHPPRTTLKLHTHEQSYLSVLLEGRYTEVTPVGPKFCTVGTILYHSPGEAHADYFHEPVRVLNLGVGESSMRRAFDNLASLADDRGGIASGFRHALRVAVKSIDDNLSRASRERPAWLSHVLDTFAWVEPALLESAARAAGVHPTHFARTFSQHIGMTASAYRRHERVLAASQLLLFSTMPLAQVAVLTGFSDQSHFTNVFRSATGLSPGLYRRTFSANFLQDRAASTC